MSKQALMAFGSEVQKYDDDAMDGVASSNDYLQRLQLLTSQSTVVKKDLSLANQYALLNSDGLDAIGTDIDIFIGPCRPKALDMSGETPVTSFDKDSEVFKDIQARSDEQDSGCMFGPEFLVWIPSQQKYATWFLATKSHRKLYKEVRALTGNAARLSSRLVETKDYSWQVSTVKASDVEFGENDFPSEEVTTATVASFNEEEGTKVEKAAEASSRD